MPTRNTRVLMKILQVINAPEGSLQRLEEHFKNDLLVVAGNTRTVARYAKKLRLHITPSELPQVLDHLAKKVRITIDHVEDAINTVFGEDRFIEP